VTQCERRANSYRGRNKHPRRGSRVVPGRQGRGRDRRSERLRLVSEMLRERGATVVGVDFSDANGCTVVDVTDGPAMVAICRVGGGPTVLRARASNSGLSSSKDGHVLDELRTRRGPMEQARLGRSSVTLPWVPHESGRLARRAAHMGPLCCGARSSAVRPASAAVFTEARTALASARQSRAGCQSGSPWDPWMWPGMVRLTA
jgi:hypothetical protein